MSKITLAWRSYQRFLVTHPIKAQGLTAGVLIGIGDILAQQVVEKKGIKGHDFARTSRQALFGAFFVGPAMISWYKVLDRLYKGSGKLVPMCKVITDQAVFAPVLITCFMSFVAWGNGRTGSQIKSQLKADFLPTLFTSYMIYPAVQVVNFYVLPVDYRPVLINVVSIFWNTYLCWKSNNPTDQKIPETFNSSGNSSSA
ncbi:hypothetical protein BSL78_11715 [Apostichopus japonicus]|uniref:Mitochondrial inner membrane protein Mpv17 n=1 Tax=Stichopus japonicus TaxID=307972 RepID=A0A2G8KTR1_STIJA|nr:hypothetical protein BSL78_11715 [Apostichopus japonicus]